MTRHERRGTRYERAQQLRCSLVNDGQSNTGCFGWLEAREAPLEALIRWLDNQFRNWLPPPHG